MAEEVKKSAIIDLQIDTGDIVKRLAEIKTSQEALKASTKELSKDYATNSEAITVNGLRMKELGKEEAALTKLAADNQKMINSQTGSIDQQRAQLSILTAQYNALSKEERENTEAGKALTKQIKGISDSLKGQEEAVGDTRRSVGNYRQAIKDAFTEMGLFSGITAKATALQDGFNKAQIIAKSAMGGTTNALGVFKLALASTGIGLIVLALGAFVTFLTKSQRGIDFVNTKLAGLKTILAVVTTQLSDMGEAIFEAFENPKQAVKDLAEAIQNNLINRVKAFAVIWEAIKTGDTKKLTDGIWQAATGITDATDKTAAWAKNLNNVRLIGEEIEKENIRIEKAERQLNVERAQSKALVEQLKFVSEDTSKSISERIKATRQAYEIEQKSVKGLIQLQKDRIANIEYEQKQSNNRKADDQKLAEERIKLAELVEGSTTRQIELNNALNSLNAEAVKLAEERRQLEADFADFKKRMNDAIALNDRQAAEDSLKRAMDRANKELDLEKNQVKFKLDQAKKAADGAIAQADREATEKERIRQLDLDKEHRKYEALSSLADGLQALNSLIAGNNAEATEFSKVLASIQIGIAVAETVGNAIKSAKGGTVFDYLLQIGIASSAAFSAIAQVEKLFSQVPEIPRPEFYEGGYTGDGDPRQESKALGKKPYIYHKQEYVIDHQTLSTPTGQMIAAVAESVRTKRGNVPSGIPGMYDGGYAVRQAAVPVQDQQLQLNNFIRAVKSLPAQEVKVSKINAAQKEMSQVRVTKDLQSRRRTG